MGFRVRVFSCALLPILTFLLPGDMLGLNAAQSQSDTFAARLDEALRQADSERARELVLDDPDGADQLFLRYLEETITQDQPKGRDTRLLEEARRLADVFFRIYEFDFERGTVSYWEKATVVQKKELLPILRDHYADYREARRLSRKMPQPIEKVTRLRDKCPALVDRYRNASFAKGELQAMLLATDLSFAYPQWKTWQQAKSLRDEVGEAWAAYYVGRGAGEGQSEFAAQHAVEAAERLHLPKLHQFTLINLAWRALAHDDYEGHINYLKKGLEVIRTIPVRQSMVSRSGCDFYPGEAWFLKTL
ncbi:MAG: hypothetical protein OEW18_12925, partial [Candidatus Aminicenantes bacterium]|nr:hypothetical protein [Candidatus Aminicenantes bacterium]